MTINILPASEVRNRFSAVLSNLRKEEAPCFVTKNGRAVAALLSMEAYEQLMSDLEDRLDETDDALMQHISEARRQYGAGKSRTLRTRRRR